METLTPILDLLLIHPDATGEETAGGIHLPQDARKRPETGTVLGVGPKVDVPVEVGDRVLYDIEAGMDVESDGLECLVMPLKYVYAVMG